MDLFQGLIDRQEWTDSGSVSQRVLRSYLLLFACVRKYAPCVNKATQLFNRWKESDGNMRFGLLWCSMWNICKKIKCNYNKNWLDVCISAFLSMSLWLCLWLGLEHQKDGTFCLKSIVIRCKCLSKVGWKQPWLWVHCRTSSNGVFDKQAFSM